MGSARGTRTATVVFTDLVGSTAQRTRLGDDVADQLRRRHDEIVGASVVDAGGEVVKSTGDGSMMVFDSATAAVESAAHFVEALARENQSAAHPILVRVGVATGDVSAEGGDLFGMPVVEAARLCDKAGTEQILATELTWMLCGESATTTFVSIGDLELKGIDGAVGVCEVQWSAPPTIHALPGPLRVDDDRPIVGRDEELARAMDAWRATRTQGTAMLTVSGEPGIGKTRFLAELAGLATAEDALVLYGRCEAGLDVAFQPIAECFRRVLDDHATSALARHLTENASEFAALLPAFAGPEVPATPTSEDDRWRLFESVRRCLEIGAAERPLLVVIDDMHWATQSTVRMIRHLVANTAGVPIMGVISYRDTEDDNLISDLLADLARVYSTRIDLSGLDRSAITELVGVDRDVDVEALATATQGNPFFLHELLHRSRDEGFERAGVRDVVLSRVDQVGPPEAEMLRAAAVLGSTFELVVIEEVLGRDLLDEVEACERAGLVRSNPDRPGVFRFAHDLVRETLYSELLGVRRARMHGRIADALVAVGSPHGSPSRVARHLVTSGLPGRSADAVQYTTEGIADLLRQYAIDEAIDLGQACIDYSTRDRTPASVALAELHLAVSNPCFLDNQNERGRLLAEQAARLAEDTDRHDLVAHGAVIANLLAGAGRPVERTLELAEMARSRVLDDPLWLGRIDGVLAYHRASSGGGAAFAPAAWSAYERVAESGDPFGLTIAGTAVLHAEAASGRVNEMRRVASAVEQSIERLVEFPWVGSLSPAHWGLAGGDRDVVERTTATLAARPPSRSSRGDLAQLHGLLHLLDGRWDDAMLALEELSTWANDDHNITLTQNGQFLAWAFEQGQERSVVDAVRTTAEENPGVPAFAAAHAMFLLPDDPDGAAAGVERLAPDGFRVIAPDFIAPAAFAFLAETSAGLGATQYAEVLLERLQPHRGNVIIIGTAVYASGAADRYRGMLMALLDDPAMDATYEAALALDRRIRSRVLETRTLACWARDLRRRDRGDDCERAEQHAAAARTLAVDLGMHGVIRDLDAIGL